MTIQIQTSLSQRLHKSHLPSSYESKFSCSQSWPCRIKCVRVHKKLWTYFWCELGELSWEGYKLPTIAKLLDHEGQKVSRLGADNPLAVQGVPHSLSRQSGSGRPAKLGVDIRTHSCGSSNAVKWWDNCGRAPPLLCRPWLWCFCEHSPEVNSTAIRQLDASLCSL